MMSLNSPAAGLEMANVGKKITVNSHIIPTHGKRIVN